MLKVLNILSLLFICNFSYSQILPPVIQDGIDKLFEPRKKQQEREQQIENESNSIVQVIPNKGNKVCGRLSYVRQTQLFDIKTDNNEFVRILLHPVVLDKNFDIYVLVDKITGDYGCGYLSSFAYRMPDGTNIWRGTVFSGYPGVDIGLVALKSGWGFYIPDPLQADNQAQVYQRAQAHAKKWKIGVYSRFNDIPAWVYQFHSQR